VGTTGLTPDEVRRQLNPEYASIVEGFRHNNPSPWIDRLGPEFQLTLFNGSVQSRAWAVNYVRNNAGSFQIDTLTMRIQSLEHREGTWVATVEQLSSRRYTDSTGTHRLDVGAIQLETWSRRPDGWKLVGVREKELLYLRRDGK
jgi:hypothetical protein